MGTKLRIVSLFFFPHDLRLQANVKFSFLQWYYFQIIANSMIYLKHFFKRNLFIFSNATTVLLAAMEIKKEKKLNPHWKFMKIK